MPRWIPLVAILGVAGIVQPAHGQAPKAYEADCASSGCHDVLTKRAFIHGPVDAGSCDACHEQTDEKRHRFKLTLQGAELCLDCHDEFSGNTQHKPVEDGQCTTCHDPHGSDTEHLLTAETLSQLCTRCHKDHDVQRKFLHGPVATGSCTTCHDPHASDHAALLFAETNDVCFKCHTAMQARITSKPFKHVPATEDCASCHDPHGADNRMFLKSTLPELCTDCHDEIDDLLAEATVGHDALTLDNSCANCHDPHASDVEHLLAKEPMDLCLSCHDKELKSGDGKVINVAKLLRDNPNHHGPIREKNCTACHTDIHGGTRFRLLKGAYPAEFYAPFAPERYAFCFDCHEPDLVAEERTDKLTNFRNGDRNLHYLHVNRKVKGRTCRACHETHASKRPRHITESVPFGEWRIPISYAKTETGGSCLPGCHKRYRYDRNEAAINIPE